MIVQFMVFQDSVRPESWKYQLYQLRQNHPSAQSCSQRLGPFYQSWTSQNHHTHVQQCSPKHVYSCIYCIVAES